MWCKTPKKQSIIKCCVKGCMKTKETDPECSFATLPNDPERQNKWLKIIGRTDLINVSTVNPKSYHVCSSHFEDQDLKQTSLLLPDAVPCRHLPEKTFIDTPLGLQLASSSVDWDEVILNPSIATSVRRSESPENRLVIVEDTNQRKKKPTKPARNDVALTIPVLQDDLTLKMHKLMQYQTTLTIDRNSKDFLHYALNLYLLNPQAYCFINDALNLPSEKVFRKMKLRLAPKLDKRVLDCLSSKLKSFPDKAKYCTVCIETLYLRNHLFYDITNDELVGLQEIDGARSDEVAGLVYVIMLRSILVKWDQPVTYCFLTGVKKFTQLESWIDGVITSLLDIGFEIMAVVTNQGSNFKKYAFEMKGVTPNNHYFTIKNKKIYYIFEVPQLVKCIRNNLGNKDIYYNNKMVSWQFIELLFRLETKNKIKLIPKITTGHVSLNNIMKMPSVRYAAEIFSNTVSRAIHTYVDSKEMPEEARDTADFCAFMNNLFDVLNSSTYKNDNIYKCALGSNESQMQLLQEALNVFTNIEWRVPEDVKRYRKRVQYVRGLANYSLPSIQVSLNSIISISQDLGALGYKRILTERLHLDPLEKLVDMIRRVVQKNTTQAAKPTPIQFCRSFTKHFLKQILAKSPLSNRPNAFSKYFEDATQLETNKLCHIPSRSQIYLGGHIDYRIQLPDDHPTIYVASYIFYKCQEAHKCDALKQYAKTLPDLAKTKVYDNYNKKAPFYGQLKLLQYPFIRYIEQLERAFTQIFKTCIWSNPGAQLLSNLRCIVFDPPCQCFPKIYAVKLLIRLRIYITIKEYNKRIKRQYMTLSQFISELDKGLQVIK